MGWAYKFMPGECLICGILNCEPEDTVLNSAKFRMNGLHFGLDLAMNFTDDLVVTDPLDCFVFFKGGMLLISLGL